MAIESLRDIARAGASAFDGGGVWLGDTAPPGSTYRHWLTSAGEYSVSDDGTTWFEVDTSGDTIYVGDTAPDHALYKLWITSDLSVYASIDGGWAQIGGDGVDGREPELQVAGNLLQWRYVGGTTWTTLFDLSTLGGGPAPFTTTLNVSTASVTGYSEFVVANAAVTVASTISAQFVPTTDAENDIEEIDDVNLRVYGIAEAGQVRFVLSGSGVFVGPFPISYEVHTP